MQKILYSILSGFLISLSCYSQQKQRPVNEEKKPFKEKIYFGGNLGLQFGSVTFIDVSPLAGYRFTDNFSVGAGITYIYIRYNQFNQYTTNIYGGRVFTRYNILDNLFLYGEIEKLNGEWDPFFLRRFYVTNVLAGAGYRQSISGRASMNFMILWNFNESAYSPYSNPIIRGGITFGI